MKKTETTLLVFIRGAMIFFLWPLLVAGGLMWFYDFVKTNAPSRVQNEAIPYRDWRPEIPQCDKPLWDRIREGCDEKQDDS